MGQTPASIQQTSFPEQQWLEATEDAQSSRFPDINPFRKRLLMHTSSARLVEEYQLQFYNQIELNNFIQQCEGRKASRVEDGQGGPDASLRMSPFIYGIEEFKNMSVNELCSSTYSGRLYIAKVDLRLKEVGDIPFEDGLCLYKACLYGFKVLYQKFGAFEITEEMIFFDQRGQVKLWINPNLSKFQPNYEPEYYNINSSAPNRGPQSVMIAHLINLIERNSDRHSSNSLSFKDYLRQIGCLERLTFSKAVQYFEGYVRDHSIVVLNCLGSICELFASGSIELDQILESRHNSEVGIDHGRVPFESSTVNLFKNSVSHGYGQEVGLGGVDRDRENCLVFDHCQAKQESGNFSNSFDIGPPREFVHTQNNQYRPVEISSPSLAVPTKNMPTAFTKSETQKHLGNGVIINYDPSRRVQGSFAAYPFSPPSNNSLHVQRYESLAKGATVNSYDSRSQANSLNQRQQVPPSQQNPPLPSHPAQQNPWKVSTEQQWRASHIPKLTFKRENLSDTGKRNPTLIDSLLTPTPEHTPRQHPAQPKVELLSSNCDQPIPIPVTKKSQLSTKQVEPVSNNSSNNLASQLFELDSQLANDMIKYLDFDPKNI